MARGLTLALLGLPLALLGLALALGGVALRAAGRRAVPRAAAAGLGGPPAGGAAAACDELVLVGGRILFRGRAGQPAWRRDGRSHVRGGDGPPARGGRCGGGGLPCDGCVVRGGFDARGAAARERHRDERLGGE